MNEILLFSFWFVVVVASILIDIVVFVAVVVDPRNLPLKSGQNRVSNR